MTRHSLLGVILSVAAMTLIAGCDGESSSSGEVRLNGAGASFPAPLYRRWVTEYDQVAKNVEIDYEAIGSGGGIKAITDKTVHFGASDAPLKGQEIENMGGEQAIIEFPSVAGSVVVVFNLPGISDADNLKLTGEIVADIYLGTIKRWNDARIAALNPDLSLPDTPITPVFRTDGSGTTYVFTQYLCTQSDPFKHTIGAGKQVNFKFGQGGKGNQGVTAAVQQTRGGVGYVEYNYAVQNDLASAAMRNRSGRFIKSSPESVAAAGAGAAEAMSGNLLAADIWNQPGDDAYPIAAFTYLIVYRDLGNLPDKAAAQQLVDFFWWATHDGQSIATQMDYAPLAQPVRRKVEQAIRGLTYKGQALTDPGS
jgi:phosphate transport system substrate-binding protein